MVINHIEYILLYDQYRYIPVIVDSHIDDSPIITPLAAIFSPRFTSRYSCHRQKGYPTLTKISNRCLTTILISGEDQVCSAYL